MSHKFAVGAAVYFESGVPGGGARGVYKIVRQLPVERDNRIVYRIKSQSETFERTAEESQLSRQY
ncbi:MAG TPA: hypothetical protein VG986_01880 [Pseudolabrys sp.]|nr:hypothetical protein [Pseudolabrys sp.]